MRYGSFIKSNWLVFLLLVVGLTALVGIACSQATPTPAQSPAPQATSTPAAAPLPGEGKTVQPARATWTTGYFQTEIYRQLLEKLGYDVKPAKELSNPIFYTSVASGDVDFWPNGWFPLHNTYKKDFESGASIAGTVAKGGALQGYLVDKKTAEELNIKSLDDFKHPEVIKAFDKNNDGKADLVACPPGWGCHDVIDYQIEAYGLTDYVNPIQAGYAASMADAVASYKAGEPIFFYTWTPNWTVNALKPGEDVVWIEVPYPDLPPDQKDLEDATTVSGITGCVADPCDLGWPANDIDVVANNDFLNNNPAAKKLFEEVRIPLEDIFAQNYKMYQGEDSQADIEKQATDWIDAHKDLVDGWIQDAIDAAS